VKNSSEVVAAYDGEPWASFRGDAYYLSDGLRSVRYNFLINATAGLVHGNNWISYTDKIIRQTGQQGQVDWRHMQRTAANVLMLDGHVESRKFDPAKKTGDLTVKDFCTNRPKQ
jgi:prepilin-type processing-associated H-X9-DG protein